METNAPYWHELSDEDHAALFKTEPPTTWKDVMERYAQPKWCGYPEALGGVMGCWSLTSTEIRKRISLDYCKGCECAAHYVGDDHPDSEVFKMRMARSEDAEEKP